MAVREMTLFSRRWIYNDIRTERIMTVSINQKPRSLAETLSRSVAVVRERIPQDWETRLQGGGEKGGVLEIASPGQAAARMLVVPRLSLDRRDVPTIKRNSATSSPAEAPIVVAAPYISESVQEALIAADLSYIDLTGNIRLSVAQPGLFVSNQGANKNPWQSLGRPLAGLKGKPAANLVRALVDYDREWTVRELAKVAETSAGSAYRVIEYLEKQGFVSRTPESKVRILDWPGILRDWAKAYSFIGDGGISRWIALRGVRTLSERIAATASEEYRYALTGSVAAAEWAPYAPSMTLISYVSDATAVAKAWGLQPADGEANVLLVTPPYDVMFKRASLGSIGANLATPAQVAVDLLNGPGRNPSEGEKLLAWMVENEPRWRRT